MMRYVGFTKNARFIFQDFTTGDVLIKLKEEDDYGISYPYEQWATEKNKIADLETIKREFNPLHPEPTQEDLEDEMRNRARQAKATAVFFGMVIGKMIGNLLKQRR